MLAATLWWIGAVSAQWVGTDLWRSGSWFTLWDARSYQNLHLPRDKNIAPTRANVDSMFKLNSPSQTLNIQYTMVFRKHDYPQQQSEREALGIIAVLSNTKESVVFQEIYYMWIILVISVKRKPLTVASHRCCCAWWDWTCIPIPLEHKWDPDVSWAELRKRIQVLCSCARTLFDTIRMHSTVVST